MKKRVAVIGTGSWGTALAILLYNNGHDVRMWSYSESEARSINTAKENVDFLPGVSIPDDMLVTIDRAAVLAAADAIVFSVPSAFVRETVQGFAPYLATCHALIVNVSKGFDEEKMQRLSEVIAEYAPCCKVVALSGPSHAEEVSRGVPTTCVAASEDEAAARQAQDLFMSSVFRVYTSTDLIGVELGGALKNVIALVAGISDGLGYGDNTKAAIMTRGMAEIARLGVAMGANPATFAGLSGVGDLIVTCTSMHSRNRRAGILIGQGAALADALKEIRMAVEGVNTVKVVVRLAAVYRVEMPICELVYHVLYEGKDIHTGVFELMNRDKRTEEESSLNFI